MKSHLSGTQAILAHLQRRWERGRLDRQGCFKFILSHYCEPTFTVGLKAIAFTCT